jgi:hypothetical protein
MAVKTRIAHPSVEERRAKGKEARDRTPPSSHTGWAPATDRPDPVGLLEEQNRARESDLVPVRHGRMLVSPFTFYRGGAKIMAADLNVTPVAGLQVQLCGDAHLSNFGVFASPERRLLFDLNDFDETLPGPFEWDVKRMAASFAIAARHNGFTKADTRAVTQASVSAYREAMASFADMGTLAIWYAHLDEDELVQAVRSAAAEASKPKKAAKAAKGAEKNVQKVTGKARTRDSLQALSKLGEVVDGRYRIVSQPPIVVPVRDWEATYGLSAAAVEGAVTSRSEPTGPACARISVSCWSGSSWSTQPARWSGWVASAPGRSSSCSRAATTTTRCSCRSRRRRPRSWRARCQKPPLPARPAGSCWPADDAGRQRHLPGLDRGGGPQPSLLLAAAAGHEGLGRGRDDGATRPRLLRRHLRVDPGPGPRPIRRPHRHRRLPR